MNRSEPGVYGVEVGGLSGLFTVLSPVPTPTGLVVTLELDKETVSPGETITAIVGVSNPNDFEVSEVLQLLVDGEVWDSKELTLKPGESREIRILLTLEAGKHVISVKGISQTVNVSAGTNWVIIVNSFIVIALLVAAAAIWVLRRRSRLETRDDGQGA